MQAPVAEWNLCGAEGDKGAAAVDTYLIRARAFGPSDCFSSLVIALPLLGLSPGQFSGDLCWGPRTHEDILFSTC